MPCTSSQGVQIPVQHNKQKLPYGSLARLSLQTGLSERTIREYTLGCNKRPRFRTAALLLLGQGFGWDSIQNYMLQHYDGADSIFECLPASGSGCFPAIPAYDPHNSFLPSFVKVSLSSCLYRFFSLTQTETGKRRKTIISELSESARCSPSCVKKLLAGYSDWRFPQTHLEPPWFLLLAFAKVCGCTRQDFNYLLSAAFPDLAMAFWIRSNYAPQEGCTTAAAEIEKYINRCKCACRTDKGLHTCNDCKHCVIPEIELIVRTQQ